MQENIALNGIDVARALKDEAYRAGLSLEAQAAIQNLVEQGELSEQDLEAVSGGILMRDSIIVRPTWVVAPKMPTDRQTVGF